MPGRSPDFRYFSNASACCLSREKRYPQASFQGLNLAMRLYLAASRVDIAGLIAGAEISVEISMLRMM